MNHLRTLSFLLLTIAFTVCATTTRAQSTDQSTPTPITSSELVITGPKKNNQLYYYSFTGGPGEVTLTLSVKAKAYSTFVGIKVFDAELNTVTYHNMSADTGSPGMALKKFDVGEKQTLVLSFTSDSSLAECRIKFGGAVEFGALNTTPSPDLNGTSPTGASMPEMTAPPVAEEITQSNGNTPGKNKSFVLTILDAVGQRFNIPTSGKLHIEMKDGSVQEIDLTQVKKLLVKQ